MPSELVELPRWRADLPADEARTLISAQIDAWARSEALARLAGAWGGQPPTSAPLPDRLDWYEHFSSEHWDFRRGRERNLAAAAELSPEQDTAAHDAAQALGLAVARPPASDRYDAILILGGLVRACVVRPKYAARLLADGVKAAEVVALGGFRPLGGDEVELADKFGIATDNELHAMVEGVQRAFGLAAPPAYANAIAADGNTDWQIASFADAPGVSVIAAPSADPQRRANSVDTYRWWAERKGTLAGARVLLVTTTIYVPYQGAGAIEVLGLDYGADVETVGVPSELADLGEDTQRFTAANYLQETRSAIRGYRSLLAVVGAGQADGG